MSNKISNQGKDIIKKGKWNFLTLIFSRFAIVIMLMFLQIVAVVFLYSFLLYKYPVLIFAVNFLVAVVIIALINVDMEPGAKLTWFAVIAILPVFGTSLYLFTKYNIANMRAKSRFEKAERVRYGILNKENEAKEHYLSHDPLASKLAHYLFKIGEFPVYDKTDIEYYSTGESQFKATLETLKNAKKFIFIESFIIEEGEMWGEVLEILKEKAKENVEIRLLYDGTCEFFRLPQSYPEYLGNLGIKCRVFSKIVPLFSTHYNYRDHRKLVIVDNEIAFTGGSNFADEYINVKERFGHWKDAGIKLKGDAVKTYTLAFLEMWEVEEKEHNAQKNAKFRKEANHFISMGKDCENSSGFVMPFTDNPLDKFKVGENVYLHLINTAINHLHICTPYLILDYEMEQALKFAAERGVDVKIVLPGIPDKKIAYAVAYTHYENLLESGVKIYEYTPGFIHQKTVIQDGDEAVLGTINLDYRSLYHHFENAVLLHGEDFIMPMEEDFSEILKVSNEIHRDNFKKEVDFWRRFLAPLVKILAPLM